MIKATKKYSVHLFVYKRYFFFFRAGMGECIEIEAEDIDSASLYADFSVEMFRRKKLPRGCGIEIIAVVGV